MTAAPPIRGAQVLTGQIPYSFKVLSRKAEPGLIQPADLAARLAQARLIALGDLHGSALKLLETLAAAGLIDMPADKAREFLDLHVQLCDLLTDAQLDKQGHRKFTAKTDRLDEAKRAQAAQLTIRLCELLATVQPVEQWRNGQRKFLLIGDVLADRGPTDAITLALMSHLQAKLPGDSMVCLAGNHEHTAFRFLTGTERLHEQHGSMRRALDLAGDPAAMREQFRDYLVQLQLAYYSPHSGTLYLHAPNPPKTLQPIVEGFKIGSLFTHKPSAQNTKESVALANAIYQDCLRCGLGPAKGEDRLSGSLELKFRELLHSTEITPHPDMHHVWLDYGVQTLVHGHIMEATSPYDIAGSQPRGSEFRVANLDQRIRCEAEGHGVNPNTSGESTLFIEE